MAVDVRIRAAELPDAPTLAEFNSRLAAETESKILDSDRLLAGVRALFEEPERGAYYVAEHANRVVGQLLVTYEWSDWRNGLFWWIQSVYVMPAYRRRGVFSTLYSHVAERAQASSRVCGLRLYVEADNTVAQAVYASLGMSRNNYRLMEVEF